MHPSTHGTPTTLFCSIRPYNFALPWPLRPHAQTAAPPVVTATVLISALGLALPYTPVGRVEHMVPLPPRCTCVHGCVCVFVSRWVVWVSGWVVACCTTDDAHVSCHALCLAATTSGWRLW